MVRIRQHGATGELFDMSSFLGDVDAFFSIDAWKVHIFECMGQGCLEVEERTAEEPTLSDVEFRRMYSGIHQTIDGSFVGLTQGYEKCRLEAIDSSYWEVTGTPDFEAPMAKTYGTYGA